MYATTSILALIAILQVYFLILFVERENRNLTRFLESISHGNLPAEPASKRLGAGSAKLDEAFARVMKKFGELRIESEAQHQYLQAVVQHIGVGLIVFRDDGQVELVNRAARRLFSTVMLKDIQALEDVSSGLSEMLLGAEPGKRQVTFTGDGLNSQEVTVVTSKLFIRDRVVTIASFQNITAELSAREVDAWQGLIRVLTHEIRNSLTPISSLSGSILESVSSEKGGSDTEVCDIVDALETIRRRSDGLLRFVDTYRRLTRIPRPKCAKASVVDILADTLRLVEAEVAERGIELRSAVTPEDLVIVVDSGMIGQVLLNLVRNSMEALSGRRDGLIELTATQDSLGQVRLTVADNGPGMIPEAIDQIFIPLYSTKKDGSGIGLSISRQIMKLHDAELIVKSAPDVRTEFILIF
jgi:nitrogen fixation/metabolism regulation signal transduction histidine kinase